MQESDLKKSEAGISRTDEDKGCLI